MSIWKPGTPIYWKGGTATIKWLSLDYPYAYAKESVDVSKDVTGEPHTTVKITARTSMHEEPVPCLSLNVAFAYLEMHAKKTDPANKLT